MESFLKVAFLLLPVVVLTLGCVLEGPFSSSVSAVNEQMVRGINDFGVSLLKELWEEKKENIFLSPVGVEMCFAMVLRGAGGNTQREIQEVLGLSGMTEEEIHRGNQNLLRTLNRTGAKVEVHCANSLWGREGIPFYQDFLEDARRFYQAEVQVVDFGNPETIAQINQWVGRETNHRIDRILDRLSPDAILVLLNAIYFKGKWQYPFDPQQTKPLPFYSLEGEEELPTMWQEGKFFYFEDESLQMIRLPYGDTNFSAYILLPRTSSGIEELVPLLSAGYLEGLIERMEERQGEIYLPRFQITFERTLNQVLQELGIRDAFSKTNADFGRMLPVPPVAFVSEAKHKSYLEVNEEGTEAAAVTSVTIALTGAMPPEKFVMRVDHPFLILIRDERNGLFLFVGVVENP